MMRDKSFDNFDTFFRFFSCSTSSTVNENQKMVKRKYELRLTSYQ